MTHDEWQEQVVDLAHLYGWRHLHVRRTVGRGKKWTTSTNVKGWPDCFFWHPTRGGSFAVELKTRNAPDVRPEQSVVLAELNAAGIPTYVWFPEDIDEARRTFDRQRGTLNVRVDLASLIVRQAHALAESGPTPRYDDDDALLLVLAARVGAEAAGISEHQLWSDGILADSDHEPCAACTARSAQ